MADEAPKFEVPDIADLDRDALLEARVRARSEIDRLNALGAEASDEELDTLEAVLSHVDGIDARVSEIDEAATSRADRIAALQERAGSVADVDAAPAEEPAAVVEAEVEAEPEVVVASGTKRPVARAASRKAPEVIIKKDVEPKSPFSITASANVPGIDSGSAITSREQLAEAFLARVGSFNGSNPSDMKAGVYQMSPRAQKFGVATFKREARDYEVNKEMSLEQQMDIIYSAGKESNLGQSLIAAGGWCAPSEIDYTLSGYETAAGLIDVPEVTARRGGIQFTKGPDFMTIFADADAGFILTETQVEAGAVKPCYALECPPFQEVRLDAVGFCATAPLLTEAAYPELVSRVLSLLNLGHQRRKSASTITRILALITNSVNWVEIGTNNSPLADALAAAELQANRIRQALAMDPNATMEGLAPYWFRSVFRNDLSRRLGLTDPFNITDADIDNWFAIRGIRFQYVYDYQMLNSGATSTVGGTNNWTEYPAQAEFAMWPAGAFTRLSHDVVNLTAVYDHDLLTQNEYTAAFMEEGIAVANTRGFGVKVTVGLKYLGASGYPSIGAPAAA